MERPEYLNKYHLDWETLDVLFSKKSAIDAHTFLGKMEDMDDVKDFLTGYGFPYDDLVYRAELFGIFQEAMQFIKRYFLIEGRPDGLNLKVPSYFNTITDIGELFLMAAGNSQSEDVDRETSLWAGIILKVMHTILYTDKDLRHRHYSIIQQQIFDRFYKYIERDGEQLYLHDEDDNIKIPIVDIETKAKKSRDSIIIKLLHKVDSVAEQIFDWIGVRIVTHNRLDALRVAQFFHDNYVVLGHNVTPSRSRNSLVDLQEFRKCFLKEVKSAMRAGSSEEEFAKKLEQALINKCDILTKNKNRDQINPHTFDNYRSMQFTCRQLIKHSNPFINEFNEVKRLAQKEDSELAKKIVNMDTSKIAGTTRFFYPFEVQIIDEESHKINTGGDASHLRYKKMQLETATKRVFAPLLDYLGQS